MRRQMLLLLFLAILPASVTAQAPPASVPERQFGILHDLVGNWEGTAWFQQPDGTRHEVTQTERVEAMAGGTVITVRGTGTERSPDGTLRTVHDAFAVVYRDRDGTPAMRAFIANGQWTDAELTVAPDGFTWTLSPVPNVTVRYVMSVDAEGRWVERGYQRYGDRPEQEFFGMTLAKKQEKGDW